MSAHPLEAWHALVRSRDPSGLADLLADDAVFVSPVVHAPQRGKALTTAYLAGALRLFFNPSFRYVREIVEFKVMLRPLKAINLIHQRMGATLAAMQPPT
jgi:ketosteroid isomerase-like protein